MTGQSPLIELNNGVEMPALGLGVYQSAPEETGSAVESAIANGYRLIDTAAAYGNEREVGEGIRRSGIDRADVFVTTKLWIADYGYEPALRAFDESLSRLGLDYVDLYLLHWPVPTDFEATVASYKAAEKVLAEGRVRAIGVCNFNPQHLEDLVARTDVVPAVNQVELHPYFAQKKVRGANASHNVLTQSWSPIGGVYKNHPKDPDRVTNLLCRPDRRRARLQARQDAGAGHPPLAHRKRALGDPQIGAGAPHRGEHRRLRLRAVARGYRRHRRARRGDARRSQPRRLRGLNRPAPDPSRRPADAVGAAEQRVADLREQVGALRDPSALSLPTARRLSEIGGKPLCERP